jgi:mono/diheme cytochrome c family protein
MGVPPALRGVRFAAGVSAGVVGVLLLGIPLGVGVRDPAAGVADTGRALSFGRDVRPILAGNCFKCHGPDEGARQAGLRLDTREGALAPLAERDDKRPAVVPGAPDRSRLIEVVSATDPAERMPPVEVSRHGLKPEEIGTLRRWIAGGAVYEAHWAFVAPTAKPPPRVRDAGWCRTDLDRWTLAALEREGLPPSAEASPETLLRRVSLDLTGLPPSPDDVRAFLADTTPGAYERAVDRLLASPRFGEKWSRWWLDMARYADTKGYEKDDRRTVWPYRDWVIRAFNSDMPFDRFTIEQLAGDMLPDATRDQVLATAFHRNTMTNDEGGTDDEEFRVAAVIDRANTTMEVWQGLTMACAQCHTHKYDPITQTEYYRFFALLNNTEDADRSPEEPFLRIISEEQERELGDAERALADVGARLAAATKAVPEESYLRTLEPPPAGGPGEARDYPWLDDLFPALAQPRVQNLGESWNWVERDVMAPASGTRCFGGTSRGGAAQQFVEGAAPPLDVRDGDTLYAYVRVDPANPAREIMLQWYADGDRWEHRAFWGEDELPYGGEAGTPAKRRMGDLPAAGEWVRLEIPAADVGLAGRRVSGWAFSQSGGTVHWDNAGLRTSRAVDVRWEESLPAWVEAMKAAGDVRVPPEVKEALAAQTATAAQREVLTQFYLRTSHRATRPALEALDAEIAAGERRVKGIRDGAAAVPVMHELAGAARRVTHRFNRGSFLTPAEEVSPGVPAALCASGAGAGPHDRLGLARWLVGDENPLTARVIANRLWEQLWGAGIVETVEDFGTQGAWPTDADLLDHLALRLRAHHWSLKAWMREVVTSATYRQSSDVTPELAERDPGNRLYARGARFRLDAETIRDVSLDAAGLLSAKMYGPPVFPPQPDGLWIMIYSSDRWATSAGEDRYRRGVYTFWRRTVPHPAMTTFDAPSREFCVSRRLRTNTPLQALVTLNDPAYVECAQAMARRVLREGGEDDPSRLRYAFLLALSRAPTDAEISRLARFLGAERAAYARDEAGATRAATEPLGPLPDGVAPAEGAAWTSVCSVLLNLDEALTRQ